MPLPIGTVLKLREPLGGAWDYAQVTGHFDAGEKGVHLVLTALGGFEAPAMQAEDALHSTGYEVMLQAEVAAQPWANDPAEPTPVMGHKTEVS